MLTNETTITAKIDWLSITVDSLQYPSTWTKERKEMPRGMHGYDTGVKYLDGRIELCSSNRKDMKPHVIFSGSCIDRLSLENGNDTLKTLRAMSHGKPTRLDIAVDVKEGTLPIEEMRDHFDNGQSITRAKKGVYMETVGEVGETLYIGSTASGKRLRIYDKAAEQGLKDKSWTRVELQLRSSFAANSFLLLINSEEPYLVIPKLIVGFVDFPEILDWVVVMGSGDISVPGKVQLEGNRHAWLMDTAAKALANEMLENGGGLDLLKAFRDRAKMLYYQKRREYK